MAAVGGWRLGFGDTLALAQALLFGIGICHRGLADVIELLAPGRLIFRMREFQIVVDQRNEPNSASARRSMLARLEELEKLIINSKRNR